MSTSNTQNPTVHREAIAVDHAESVATSRSQTAREIARYAYKPTKNIWLGSNNGNMIGYEDDRHMVTIGGNRGGKGISAIVPVLLDYPMSVFVLDPKGENAILTADRRGQGNENIDGMGQKVIVLDPYFTCWEKDLDDLPVTSKLPQHYFGSFNPMDTLPDTKKAISEADTLAESFIIFDGKSDPHWAENAQQVLQALILHVKSSKWLKDEERNFIKVRQLLTGGDLEYKKNYVNAIERKINEAELELESPDDPDNTDIETLQGEIEDLKAWLNDAKQRSGWDYLLDAMSKNEAYDGFIQRWVETFKTTAPNERMGFLSSARTNTKFLEDEEMEGVLKTSTFSLKEFRENPNGFSLYLCLPAGKLGSSGRWLRAILGQTIRTFEKMGTVPKEQRRTLFVLDEFASLGHMQTMEKYAALIAGYGVKFWYIYQDLQQMQRNYKESWETILNTAGVIQAFSTTDKLTTEYLSARMGKIEMERERTTSSTSTTQGKSEGFNSGEQQGFAPGANFQGNAEQARQASSGVYNDFVQTGASSGLSEGTSSSTTSSTNTASQFVVNNLRNPDELARDLKRENKNQLLLISGEFPMFIDREYFFEHRQFRGKYDNNATLKSLEEKALRHIKSVKEVRVKNNKDISAQEARIKNCKLVMGWCGLIAFLSVLMALRIEEWLVLAVIPLCAIGAYMAYKVVEEVEYSMWNCKQRRYWQLFDFYLRYKEHFDKNPLLWLQKVDEAGDW